MPATSTTKLADGLAAAATKPFAGGSKDLAARKRGLSAAATALQDVGEQLQRLGINDETRDEVSAAFATCKTLANQYQHAIEIAKRIETRRESDRLAEVDAKRAAIANDWIGSHPGCTLPDLARALIAFRDSRQQECGRQYRISQRTGQVGVEVTTCDYNPGDLQRALDGKPASLAAACGAALESLADQQRWRSRSYCNTSDFEVWLRRQRRALEIVDDVAPAHRPPTAAALSAARQLLAEA